MTPPSNDLSDEDPNDLSAEALRIQDVLDSLGSRSIVVPCPVGKKQPMFPHRGGVWTRDASIRFFKSRQPDPFWIGILLRDECVYDFDSMEIYESACARFGELRSAPAETTSRGMHVFFLRSPAVDAANLTDNPLNDPETGRKLEIDFKTHTNSVVGEHVTRALVVVSPSAGRSWVHGRSIFDKPMEPPSLELVRWTSERARAKGKKRPRAPHDPIAAEAAAVSIVKGAKGSPPLQYTISGVAARVGDRDELIIKPIESTDKADVFGELALGKASSRLTQWANGLYSGVSFKAQGACPCCRRTRPHNNQYYTTHTPEGVRRLRNHGCTPSIVVAYKPASTAAYQDRWRTAANAAFLKIPDDASAHLTTCLASLKTHTAVSTWWDGVADVLYCEFATEGGAATFAAVGIDAGPVSWVDAPDVVTVRVGERPNCFGDLLTAAGPSKNYLDGQGLKTLARLVSASL